MSSGPNEYTGRPLVGVALVAFAVLAFAISDVLSKYLVERHPVGIVIAVRYLISLVLLLMILWPKHRNRLWRTNRTGLVILRGLTLTVASLTMGYALQRMPVAETISILYLSPFVVMLLAIPLLGERVSIIGWIGAIVGFSGVLLILRPGGGLDPIGIVFALLNASFATVYHLMTRFLARSETTIAMLFYVTLTGAIFFSVMAIGSVSIFRPTPLEIGLLILLGICATFGHFLFTAAYREAPASMLAPVNYLHLFWAAGLGWLVFDHVPTGLTLAGMLLVAGSGMLTAMRARKSPPH